MKEDLSKVTYIAVTDSRGKRVPFGIKRRDRARHMYIVGKTGMGKSTLLENMAIQDIRNGEGVAFIDPHGSTADRLLEFVPEHRIKDVVYFAPFDMDFPIAFNVMEDVGYDKRHLVVSGLLSAFRKIWVDAWSARMEYILSNTLLALLEYDGATLLDVNRMLINKVFRKKVVENITDPIVKSFWVDEFANYTDRYTQDATPAIQNKIGQFTSNPLIRNIVGQPKSSFDIRKLMDDRKILIMNLSKGRVGEVNATLLGSMLVTKVYLAAMSRADASASALEGLPSFYFYVDEFQSFANQTFADILSEARKYKLNLIIAHQYIEQMEEEVRDAVFGNVGTTIAFRVGPFDAEVLETVFSPQFTAEDLVNLGFAQIYLTLMIDGVGSQPFSATTMAAFDFPPQRFVSEVLQSSRTRYAAPRTEVETAIDKWQSDMTTPPPSAPKVSAPKVAAPESTSLGRVERPVAPAPQVQASPKRPDPKPYTPPVHKQYTPAPAPKPERPKQQDTKKHHAQEQHPRQPQRPPLTGAVSLKEAIARATKENGGSLSDVLKRVAPESKPVIESKPVPPPTPLRTTPEEPVPAKAPDRASSSGMSEEELRRMLQVEGYDEGK